MMQSMNLVIFILSCFFLKFFPYKIYTQLAKTMIMANYSVALTLNCLSICNVSIPIALCLFFMMYPIMVKIDFAEILKMSKMLRPGFLTLFLNWCIKPFYHVSYCIIFFRQCIQGFFIINW